MIHFFQTCNIFLRGLTNSSSIFVFLLGTAQERASCLCDFTISFCELCRWRRKCSYLCGCCRVYLLCRSSSQRSSQAQQVPPTLDHWTSSGPFLLFILPFLFVLDVVYLSFVCFFCNSRPYGINIKGGVLRTKVLLFIVFFLVNSLSSL